MKMPEILNNTKTRDSGKYEKRMATLRDNVRRYKRTKFCRVSADLESFFKWHPLKGSVTLDGLAESLREHAIDYYLSRDYIRDEYVPMDDATEIVRYATHYRMPARVAAEMADEIRNDAARAMGEAALNDYEAQYQDWLFSEIESAADDIGASAWAFLDNKGNPTTDYYDSESVGFAWTRAAFMDRTAEHWPVTYYGFHTWDNYDSNRERLDAADEILGEHVGENLGKINLEFFDERGARYGDPDEWPQFLVDYSETADAWRAKDRNMRERLREMIANRAPLESRAALIATVYGNP